MLWKQLVVLRHTHINGTTQKLFEAGCSSPLIFNQSKLIVISFVFLDDVLLLQPTSHQEALFGVTSLLNWARSSWNEAQTEPRITCFLDDVLFVHVICYSCCLCFKFHPCVSLILAQAKEWLVDNDDNSLIWGEYFSFWLRNILWTNLHCFLLQQGG